MYRNFDTPSFILQKDSIRYILLQFFSQIKKYVKICFYNFFMQLCKTKYFIITETKWKIKK